MLEDYLHNKEIQRVPSIWAARQIECDGRWRRRQKEGKNNDQEIWQSSSNIETKLFTHKMYAELVQNRYIPKNTDKVDDKSLYGTWL